MTVKWLDEPQTHDYDAAGAYLSMAAEKGSVDNTNIPCHLVSWH